VFGTCACDVEGWGAAEAANGGQFSSASITAMMRTRSVRPVGSGDGELAGRS
jgi:hypothetical protein